MKDRMFGPPGWRDGLATSAGTIKAHDALKGRILFDSQAWLLPASILTLILFLHQVYGIWAAIGLFNSLGMDFAIFSATVRVVTEQGWTHLYDTKAITETFIQSLAQFGPAADKSILAVSPYPAVFVVPFLLTNCLGLPGGFAAWTALNVMTLLAITRGLLRGSEHPGLVLYLAPFVFLPVLYNLYLGQLAIVMAFGLYKSYTSFREGHDRRAGLWLGLLLLKPQFALVLAMVLLAKGRWQALGGLFLAGLGLAFSTFALVGVEGVRDYLAILRLFSGFRRVPSIVNAKAMINFRGILVNLLPESWGESQGTALVVVLSVALILSLAVVWRGRWNPSADRFPQQMLATFIVSMLIGYHTHIYGPVVLIVPMLDSIARPKKSGLSPNLFWLTLFLPTFMALVVGKPEYFAGGIMGVMACLYGVIFAESCRSQG